MFKRPSGSELARGACRQVTGHWRARSIACLSVCLSVCARCRLTENVLSVNSAHVDRRTLPLLLLLLLLLMNISATIPSAHQFASPGAALRGARCTARRCRRQRGSSRQIIGSDRLGGRRRARSMTRGGGNSAPARSLAAKLHDRKPQHYRCVRNINANTHPNT